MNLAAHPDLLEQLAAAYALGTLRHGARRRFETLARAHPPVRAAALNWQMRFASLTELQPGVEPSLAVWKRIDNLVRADLERRAQLAVAAAPPAALSSSGHGGWRSLLLWRTAAIGGVLAAVLALQNAAETRQQDQAALAELQNRLAAAPIVEYVAVLSGTPDGASILVQFDPNRQRLTLKRISPIALAADKSLQLWALPPGQAPRSLGVLGDTAVERLQTSASAIANVPTLAISLEPLGGVPGEGGPTGPVLFKGALLATVS